GSKVVQGCIAIEKSNNQMEISQKCPKAVIDWQDFSLDEGESLKFIQKDNFSILNRVVSDNISKIYGSIEASSKFYLINQNGILIGPTGSISAKEVLLSTLEISKEDYLRDKDLRFSSLKDGKIENFGSIKAIGSNVYILSKTIENHKNITAKYGDVNLIAASEVLIFDNKNDIIIKPATDGSITNEGNIKAIEIKLQSSNNSLDSFAINQKGLIEARGFKKRDGKVILVSERGICQSEGKIIAKNENETGGIVHLLGDRVNLINDAQIDVSAKNGGGEVLIGGDYQGKNPEIQNAKTVFVSKDAKIIADAIDIGNGGRVIFWADQANQFYGDISAKGGTIKGDGGFVEISSKNLLDFHGKIVCSAPNGKNGTLLLDPSDIDITTSASSPAFPTTPPGTYNPTTATANLDVADVTAVLDADTDVIILTAAGSGGVGTFGTIEVLTNIIWSGTGNLTMNADLFINIQSRTIRATGAANLTLVSTNRTLINNSLIENTSGSGTPIISITGNSGVQGLNIIDSTIRTTLGSISLEGTGSSLGIAFATSTIESLGVATVTITGENTTTVTPDHSGISFDSTIVRSAGGAIVITGNGRGTTGNEGVLLSDTTSPGIGEVTATGSASITINGTIFTTGNTNRGISVGVPITSASGDIIINGAVTILNSVASLLIDDDITSTSGNITVAGSAVNSGLREGIDLTATSTIDAGSGDITISSNNPMTLAGTVQSTGDLFFETVASSIPIIVGGSKSQGLSIDTTSITALQNGFNSITIGEAAQTGTISVNAASFDDPVFILGRRIDMNGILQTTAGNITCTVGTGGTSGTFNLNSTVSPAGSFLINGTNTISDTFNININPASQTATLNGGTISGAVENVLAGPDLSTTWPVTGLNSGTLGNITYSNINDLQGGDAGNIFNFSASGEIKNLTGGAAADTINFLAAWAGDITGTSIGGSGDTTYIFFGDFDVTATLDGGTGSNEVTNSSNSITPWVINGANQGTLQPGAAPSPTNFSNIDTLTGGTTNDTFSVTHTVGQTLLIDGGSGGTNTVTGPNASNIWTIGSAPAPAGDDRGTLKVALSANLISFLNIETVLGGPNSDDFVFGGIFILTGATGVDGNGGTNLLTGASGETNLFTIGPASDNVGNITIDGTDVTTFVDIQKVVGGGTASNNTLLGRNITNDFLIDSANGGNLNGAGSLLFENVGNLTGNIQNDLYRCNNGSISGALDGGANTGGDGNKISTTLSTGTIIISMAGGSGIVSGSGITDIQTIEGGTAAETLIGRDEVTTWTITGSGTGTFVNTTEPGGVSFIAMDSLQGGSNNDLFLLSAGGSMPAAGQINGSTGINTLQTSNAVNNIWQITEDDAGNVTPTALTATNFTNIQNLTGSTADDTFQLSDQKGISGILIGGASCAETNVLDYALYLITSTVTVTGLCPSVGVGTATNIDGGIQFITSFIPPGGIPPLPPIPSGRTPSLERAYFSELLITYDLKDFAEFNSFLNRYKLIYIKRKSFDSNKNLEPEYEDKMFLRIGKKK
ncbi:MAG: hypothetical protein K1000chlam1_00815, partial [Candidatus Anoxychlamydiales bacterium]|nr:hypothetical protein [Candidatus Anoxychlamydiales bacterium]